MRLAQRTETFEAPEDHSWLGSRHATDTGENITLDASAWIGIFDDGIVPSGVLVARRTSDDLGIPYADTTVATATITRTATGGTINAFINGEGSDDFAIVAATTAAEIQTALRAIGPDFAGVTVAGAAGGPFTVTFTGVDGDVNFVIDDSDATGGSVTVADGVVGGGETPAGEGVPVGHLFTTKDIGDGTGYVGASYLWHGQVVVANLPTGHGLTDRARALLPQMHYVD